MAASNRAGGPPGDWGGNVCGAIDPAKAWSLFVDFAVDTAPFDYAGMEGWLADGDRAGLGFFAGVLLEAGASVAGPGEVRLGLEDWNGAPAPTLLPLAAGIVHRLEVRFTPAAPPPSTVGDYRLYVDGSAVGAPRFLDMAGVEVLIPFLNALPPSDDHALWIVRVAMHALA